MRFNDIIWKVHKTSQRTRGLNEWVGESLNFFIRCSSCVAPVSCTYSIRQRNFEQSRRRTTKHLLRRGLEVLLEGTLVLLLLGEGLVSTVTELGRGIDPLELDLLEGTTAGVGEHGLAESHNPLLDTRAGTLDHDEVVLDLTVADETTHAISC
jgi:hypothetical protein